jgi:predicted acetyltransferase
MLDVQEYVYVSEEACRGLWNFISQHDSMIEKVKIIAPGDDQLPFSLSNPKIQRENVPYFMARIVDLLSFLSKHLILLSEEKVAFHATDSFAEWNTGTYTVQGQEVLFEPGAYQGKGVTGDVGTITALLLGVQKPAFLYQCGKLQAARR